ncbi:MAG: VWA domain-containing protein [Deltaproteobacteria bacterium]|nr:VWA domain-containing protein [Deltaproteobacteria bacterium]
MRIPIRQGSLASPGLLAKSTWMIALVAIATSSCARTDKDSPAPGGGGAAIDEPPRPSPERSAASTPKAAEAAADPEPTEELKPMAQPDPAPAFELPAAQPADAPAEPPSLRFEPAAPGGPPPPPIGSAGKIEGLGSIDTGGGAANGHGFLAGTKGDVERELDDAFARPDSGLLETDEDVDLRARSGEDAEEKKEEAKPKVKDLSRFSRRDGDMTLVPPAVDELRFVRPDRVLPRIFYFENTYLGGSAAYAERLRRLERALGEGDRHYRRARAEAQPFDPPSRDGLAVTASVDATHLETAQRVFLQVGLQGSDRYGWRRPPLDVALVVDPRALGTSPGLATGFVIDLLRKLGSADRLAIVVAGETPETFLDLARTPNAQQHLARRIDEIEGRRASDVRLGDAMRRAGEILAAASDAEAVVPGSQTILVLTGPGSNPSIPDAARAAHDLSVQGAVTSVFTLDLDGGTWWQVANAGHGNFHRIDASVFRLAIDEELASLARVVARLVRVNIRLGKDAHAIRVLGTRVLDAAEVKAVKEREVATDRNLSKTLGIVSDRGEDDDGIQTVIPYFYGDDSHVILVELWVDKPGLVADVTVRYKDMVNLDNATARTSVRLGARPEAPSREQRLIAQNVRGFMLAESLQRASNEVRRGDAGNALRALEAARAMAAETNPLDQQAVDGLKNMVERGAWQYDANERTNVEESLLISGQRRVGDTARDE